MQNLEEKYINYYLCSYYDDIIGTMEDFPIPTSQTRNSINKKEFKKRVIELLNDINSNKWPYKERLTITVNISGLEKYINRIDIDNVLKNLLDIFKGKVYIDDKQIFSIMAEKQINITHGFFVGIRILKENEINNCIPPMFSPYKEHMKKENTAMWIAKEIL